MTQWAAPLGFWLWAIQGRAGYRKDSQGNHLFSVSLLFHILVINNAFFLFILSALAVLSGPANAHFTFLDFLSS